MDLGKFEADVYKDIETKINALGIELIILEGKINREKEHGNKEKRKDNQGIDKMSYIYCF